MPISLIDTPERIDGAITSRFVAVGNPLKFTFQYNNSGTFTAVSFGTLNGQVFVELSALEGKNVGDFLRLTRLSDAANVFTTITRIDETNLRYFLNLTVNEGYSLTVNQWYEADYNLSITLEVEGDTVASSEIYPFKDGSFFFDPAKYLERQLQNINDFDYTSTIYKDPNAAKDFVIKYQEYYAGALQGSEETTDTFTAVNAANQILNEYDSNLLGDIYTPTQGRVLTAFSEPRIWEGYPFDISILTQSGQSPDSILTPDGVNIALDSGKFDAINRIALTPSNFNGVDGCITPNSTIPATFTYEWTNFVCEVTPTVTTPPPLVQPIPEPEPPAFCNQSLGSTGGADGIFDYSYLINFTGYFAILFEPYTFTDKAELGKLQSDLLTVDILATTHMVNTDPSLNIDPNSGQNTTAQDINALAFDANGRRFLSGDALGSGVEAGGCDAIDQYIGLAKLNPNPDSVPPCVAQPDYPLRLTEYIAATGDNNPPQIFGSGKLQYVWLAVSPGDNVIVRVSGRSGTLWNIPNLFCYQTN